MLPSPPFMVNFLDRMRENRKKNLRKCGKRSVFPTSQETIKNVLYFFHLAAFFSIFYLTIPEYLYRSAVS
jgi:preprotein translocase subunit SecE